MLAQVTLVSDKRQPSQPTFRGARNAACRLRPGRLPRVHAAADSTPSTTSGSGSAPGGCCCSACWSAPSASIAFLGRRTDRDRPARRRSRSGPASACSGRRAPRAALRSSPGRSATSASSCSFAAAQPARWAPAHHRGRGGRDRVRHRDLAAGADGAGVVPAQRHDRPDVRGPLPPQLPAQLLERAGGADGHRGAAAGPLRDAWPHRRGPWPRRRRPPGDRPRRLPDHLPRRRSGADRRDRRAGRAAPAPARAGPAARDGGARLRTADLGGGGAAGVPHRPLELAGERRATRCWRSP